MEKETAMALTIPALVAERVAAHGSDIVLRKKERGIWRQTTWAQLGARVGEVSRGLKAIGFHAGDVACVLAETRPEWVHLDLGILSVGGVSGGLDLEQEAEQLGQALQDARCRVLFVENEEQLDKALLVRGGCATLQHIVIIDTKGLRDFADPMCESLHAFIARGSGESWKPDIVGIAADQPAALLLPRGGPVRILTHRDALHLVANARALLPLHAGDERVAVLPMCDAMERVLGLYLSLDARVISNYLENPDTVIENLREVQPTVLATDARIWRMLYSLVTDAAAGATHLQRLLYRAAIAGGTRGGLTALFARIGVLHAVRREIGLGRLRVAYAGGTKLPAEIEAWAAALGIRIQAIDGDATQGAIFDTRNQALMAEAYGT